MLFIVLSLGQELKDISPATISYYTPNSDKTAIISASARRLPAFLFDSGFFWILGCGFWMLEDVGGG